MFQWASRQVALLRDKLKAIDRRRAEIEGMLVHVGAEGYRAQELRSEAGDLAAIRSVTDKEIRTLTHAPTKIEERQADDVARRRKAVVDQWVREQEEVVDNFIRQLEAQGDHRQARLWRLQKLDIRAQVERQLGG